MHPTPRYITAGNQCSCSLTIRLETSAFVSAWRLKALQTICCRQKSNQHWNSFIDDVETLNPLTTEFFPPRQHIFMHSAHTTFVGTPLPQHSLLSGQTWWGSHTWRDPSGNTVNDIHDPPQAQQSEVKGGCQLDFRPAFP